jgi:hypothetical protein
MSETDSLPSSSTNPIARKHRWIWLELAMSVGFSAIAIWVILKNWSDFGLVPNLLRLWGSLCLCWFAGNQAGRYISLMFVPADYWISPEGVGLRRGLVRAKTVGAARFACLFVASISLICPVLVIYSQGFVFRK